MSYSQNQEDLIVKAYFNGHTGRLLDIGANDGITFSNSRLLIEMGWSGWLIEPNINANAKLDELYKDNKKINIHKSAFSTHREGAKLYASGAHVKGGTDDGLVSTIHAHEVERWGNVAFTSYEVPTTTFGDFYSAGLQGIEFDFISIDIEGEDWNVLQQINLSEVGCKCLCIEWNSQPHLAKLYTDYCAQFGLKEIHRNAENIIYVI